MVEGSWDNVVPKADFGLDPAFISISLLCEETSQRQPSSLTPCQSRQCPAFKEGASAFHRLGGSVAGDMGAHRTEGRDHQTVDCEGSRGDVPPLLQGALQHCQLSQDLAWGEDLPQQLLGQEHAGGILRSPLCLSRPAILNYLFFSSSFVTPPPKALGSQHWKGGAVIR